jgi:peptide/nickel transport system permease protein
MSSRPAAGSRSRISAIGVVALGVLVVAVVAPFAGELLTPFDPFWIDIAHWQGYPLAPGVAGHVLGTDENGRDVLARLLLALRMSLLIAVFAAFAAAALGAVVARMMKAPRFDRRDAIAVTAIRPFAGFPFILAAVTVFAASSGKIHFLNPPVIALMIAAVAWPAIVPAFRTFTPATLGAVVDLTACALLIELTESALGFGVQPPIPSLGNMLVNSLSNVTIGPWIPIVPSAAAVATLFALYALGDELRGRGSPPAARG